VWTRFELVAAAKEWSPTKRAPMLPMLLWGKLELIEETKTDLGEVKKLLMSKAV